MEINYKQIGVILVAIILTGSGAIYLQRTGEYHNCRAEWVENIDGTFTCPKDNQTDYCFEIENRGSGWYRCWIGVPINVNIGESRKINQDRWICNPKLCEVLK